MKPHTSAQEKTQVEKLSRPLIEKVAIIGAGLGGLAVAVALRKLGCDVQVYEKALLFSSGWWWLGIATKWFKFP